MEGGGMFSKTISELTTIIYNHADHKALPHLAYSVGLPIREGYSLERTIFTLAQVIANLLDEMVSPEGEMRRRRRAGGHGKEAIEGHSTLNSAPNCLAGNFNIAAIIFGIFCPRLSIWNILDIISSARVDLAQEEAILEDVRLKNRIFYLPNLRNAFSCHCLIFSDDPHLYPLSPLVCSFCGSQYHGECQSTPIFCNSCFLRFCVFDLREELGDAYNRNKEVQLAYFTYIENAYAHPHPPEHDCTYFHIAKFDLPEMNNLEKKDKTFYLKLALVDRIFSGELELGKGKRRQPLDFWDVEDTEYFFYLNHNEIKITNTLSDYAVIFKVIPRFLLPSNNILVIRCVKRNIRYDLQQPSPFWNTPSKENPTPIIMMGVYQTNKIKASSKQNKLISSKNTIPELEIAHSILYLEHVLQKINKIEYQMVDLLDVTNREKIVNPVRSFGCTHVECFDFEEYKHKVKPNTYKSKSVLKKRKLPIDVDQQEQEENNIIDLDSNSVVIVDPPQPQIASNPTPTNFLTMTPVEKRKEFLRRKRQKERREKREKDSLFCPICNKRMLSLYTDPLFKQILLNSGFYSKVQVYRSGEFNFEPVLPKIAK